MQTKTDEEGYNRHRLANHEDGIYLHTGFKYDTVYPFHVHELPDGETFTLTWLSEPRSKSDEIACQTKRIVDYYTRLVRDSQRSYCDVTQNNVLRDYTRMYTHEPVGLGGSTAPRTLYGGP
jgi:hypothetical protein